mgnify:CR=1 FL=1
MRAGVLVLICLSGCLPVSDQKSDSAPLASIGPPLQVMPTGKAVAHLLETPPDPRLPTHEPSAAFPIPSGETFAADGRSFALHVSRSSARIKADGGIAGHIHETYGPWPLTNPDVFHLRAVLQTDADMAPQMPSSIAIEPAKNPSASP